MTLPRSWHPGTWLTVFIASPLMLFCTLDATAVDINMDVIPSLRLVQGWDSNIFNTSTDVTSDFFFRAKPELALRLNTPGAGVKLAGSVEGKWFYNHPEANQEATWNLTLGLDGGKAVQITSKLAAVPSVYYINTRNSSRRTQLLPSGDPVLPQPAISTYSNVRSDDFGGGLAFKYLVMPNWILGLTGNYGERRFSGGKTDNTLGLTNSSTVGGRASISYIFTPGFSAGVDIAGSREIFENNPDTDIMSAGILMEYQISRAFLFVGRFGMTSARRGSSPVSPEQKSSDPSGNINVFFFSGTFNANAHASAIYTGGSGYGGIARQETIGLDISDQLARNWYWNLSGGYQRNRSVFTSNEVELNTTYSGGGLRYQPWSWGTFDLTGYLIEQKSYGQFGQPIDYFTVMLGFTVGKTYTIF